MFSESKPSRRVATTSAVLEVCLGRRRVCIIITVVWRKGIVYTAYSVSSGGSVQLLWPVALLCRKTKEKNVECSAGCAVAFNPSHTNNIELPYGVKDNCIQSRIARVSGCNDFFCMATSLSRGKRRRRASDTCYCHEVALWLAAAFVL